jgi:PBSX family phage terminase large subunit
MLTVTLDRPSEKQKEFLRDHHKYVGYGGARGGGKSWAVQTKAVLLALKHKGIRLSIFRRTYPELERNHIRVLVPKALREGVATYNKQEKRLTFTTGSSLEFVFAQREADLNKIQGNQWDVIFVDEATQWSEEELKIIAACCRGVNNFPKRIYYTCNPGGVGHQYIKRIFIDRKYTTGEDKADYSWIPAKVTDNLALMQSDPDYVRYLEALPPKLKKAWLDGDWSTMSGAYFEEFRDDPDHYDDQQWTHVINPFTPPPHWNIMMGYDYGYSKPFSASWYAIDDDGRMYKILEWYGWNGEPNEGLHLTADQQFAHIREIEDQHPWLKGKKIRHIADPAIWDAESGTSIAETAASKKYRIYFEKGDHARISGWMQCHYRLQFDENGIPMFYVFNTCQQFIRTIQLQQYDEHKVEDLDTDIEDHAMDDWRYTCMGRPIKAHIPEKKQPLTDDPLNQRVPKRRGIYISHGYQGR